MDDDGNKVPDTKFAEYDTVSGEWFLIDALSFGPVRMTVRGESKVVFPIVVRPCEHLETNSVNAALSRVVSCVLTIQSTKSIRVSCSSRLAEVESDTWHTDFDQIVPPKTDNSQPGYTIVIDRARSEMAWPVRAHIELIIRNDRAE